MRNLTIPEACLVVGTAVVGSAAFLVVEIVRLDHRPGVGAQVQSATVQAANAAAPAPMAENAVPSLPPLAAEPAQGASPPTKKRKPKRITDERARDNALDLDCANPDDPLCGSP